MMNRLNVAFGWLAWIFAAGLIVQVFIAGLALFTGPDYWSGHAVFARYFSPIPVLMLAVSIIGRLPASLRQQCFVLIAMIAAMFITGLLAGKLGFVSALHPVIAVFLFFRTMAIISQSAAAAKT